MPGRGDRRSGAAPAPLFDGLGVFALSSPKSSEHDQEQQQFTTSESKEDVLSSELPLRIPKRSQAANAPYQVIRFRPTAPVQPSLSPPASGSSSSRNLDDYRELIRHLYVEEERQLDEVIEILRAQHGFLASRNMMKKKIRQWSMYKKLNRGASPSSPSSTSSGVRSPRNILAVRKEQLLKKRDQSEPQQQRGQAIQRRLSDPADVMVPQAVLTALQAYMCSRLEPRLHFTRAQQGPDGIRVDRRPLPSPTVIGDSTGAIVSGIQAVTSGKTTTSGAFFERGFRLLQEMLQTDHFSIHLKMIEVMLEIQKYNLNEIGRLYLQHFVRLAATMYGPNHPHLIWGRNALALYDTPGLFLQWCEAASDIMQNFLGVEDNYSLITRSRFLYYSCEAGMSPDIIVQKYDKLLEDCRSSMFVSSFPFLHVQYSYGNFLIDQKRMKMAETVLAPAPGWVAEYKHKPIMAATLLDSSCLLAIAQAAQGKDTEADKNFRLAISIMIDMFGIESESALRNYLNYANFLKDRGREDEVKTIYDLIDSKMEPYMLRPETNSGQAVQAAQSAQSVQLGQSTQTT